VKVCVVTSQYGDILSGLGTYATNLINALVVAGHNVSVLCPVASAEKAHPGVVLLDSSSIKIAPDMSNWMLLSFLYNKLLVKVLQKESFDIIHFTDARESLFCNIKNTPVIGTMNDYYFMEAPKNPFDYRKFYTDWLKRWLFYNVSRALEKIALNRLSVVIANTDYVRNSVVCHYRVALDKVRTVHYGLDNPALVSTEASLDGEPSILFVGANFQRKGLPTLIKAVALVKKHYPEVMLHVVGNDAKQLAMETLAQQQGVSDNIRFLGGMDNAEVQELHAQAQVFCMPSLIEGFGIVFLEAMAAGTSVIGGNCGGTPELIQDGENGFVVSPHDCQALAERIQQLAGDPILREKFRQQGIKSFTRFSVGDMLDKTLAVYAEQVELNPASSF